jgi:uncharacterized protein YqjF (DUF2071 family)
MAPVFPRAVWRDLLMVNWVVDPAVVAPLVPRATELDFHDGKTDFRLVGFRVQDAKLFGWLPIPFHRNVDEINSRFYVVRRHPDGDRRGVVFVKKIVPRHAIALTAWLFHQEPCQALPTGRRVERDHGAMRVSGLVRYA